MADSKKLVKLLPEEYQELEYIQSGLIYLKTGYIDTGLVGTDLYGCEIETCMKVSAITNSNLYYLNGAYESGQTTQTGLIREDTEYVHSVVNMGFNTASYSGSIALNDWHTIYTSDGIQKTDGVIVSNETYGTFNNSHYLLFARTDTDVTLSPPFAMKYFQIKKNGQYIRNMIPAKRKSDNVVGMYDIANDVFYTSENQYAFIGGDAVDYWQHSLRKLGTSTDTITTLPADLYADGTNATVGISGNMEQNGTPTPSNPVEVNGVGERTENLFDYQTMLSGVAGHYLSAEGSEIINDYWAITKYIPVDGTTFTLSRTFGGGSPSVCLYDVDKHYITGVSYNNNQITTISDSRAKYARFSYFVGYEGQPAENVANDMLVKGSTAPSSYIPYGIKIPISSGGVTTNIYLGSMQTVRQIKKIVFDGTEDNWRITGTGRMGIPLSDLPQRLTTPYCTHFIGTTVEIYGNMGDGECSISVVSGSAREFGCYDSTITTLADFKAYLQAQYAAGTPVTVWYVLANETTGIVNEPIRKIGNYADTISGITIPTTAGANSFDVLTTLKPSEVSLAYTGWHDATVKDKSKNLWNEDYTDISSTAKYVPINVGEGNFTLSTTFQQVNGVTDIFLLSGNVTSGISSTNNGAYAGKNVTKASIDGYVTIAYRNYARETAGSIPTCQTMLNSGSTALSYEPYWK